VSREWRRSSTWRARDVIVLRLSTGGRLAIPREYLQGLEHATEAQLAEIQLWVVGSACRGRSWMWTTICRTCWSAAMGMRGGWRRCNCAGSRRRASGRVEERERLPTPASQVRSPGTRLRLRAMLPSQNRELGLSACMKR